MNFLISVRPNLPTRFHLMLWQVLINLSCDTIPFSPPAVKCVFHQASLILGWLKDPFVKKLTLVLNPDPCFSPVRQLFITNIVSSSFKQPVNEMRLSNRWSYKSGVWVEKLVIYPRFRGLLVQHPLWLIKTSCLLSDEELFAFVFHQFPPLQQIPLLNLPCGAAYLLLLISHHPSAPITWN